MRYRPAERVLDEILNELINAYLPSETLGTDQTAQAPTQKYAADDLAAAVLLGLKELRETGSQIKRGLNQLNEVAAEVRQSLQSHTASPNPELGRSLPSSPKPLLTTEVTIQRVTVSPAGTLATAEPGPDERLSKHFSQSERIMVVQSEEPIAETISSMLNAAGYRTWQARSGPEALGLLNAAGECELMLADVWLPEMDGLALLERSMELYPDMPVVLVTAVNDVSVILGALRHGAYDYLLKPFEREQLLAIVRRALERRRLKLENRAYQSNLESLVAARTEQLRQAMTDLERSYDITLEALGDTLDLRHGRTQGHSKRITAFTIAIARSMGLSGDRIRVIARAALLHDIGKSSIPDAILGKPGRLTPEEEAIMREYCVYGYQMLHAIPFLAEASEIVYAQEERFDGTGYPRGLRGNEIPLGARILAVASTLESITCDRPDTAVAVAREEIRHFSGSKFDPEVVRIALAMPESIWEDLRREINSVLQRVRPLLKSQPKAQPEQEKPARQP